MENFPETLMDAVRYFSDENRAHQFVIEMRWPDGVRCPRCGSEKVNYVKTRRQWKCRGECAEKRTFSAKVGTIFEDSPLPFGKWMVAIWMLINAKNGVSSYEIARSIGVTQKTAWFMMHRIRFALHYGSIDTKLEGRVEADETYIGAKVRRMNRIQRHKQPKDGRFARKTIVMGVLKRGGEIRTEIVPDESKGSFQGTVRKHVEAGAELMTDKHRSYMGLRGEYVHEAVDHAIAYAHGHVHTNGVENFWSLLRRCIHGTYVAIEPFHLFRYLDEQCFRFNARKGSDRERFKAVVGRADGKRLTYRVLTGASDRGCVS